MRYLLLCISLILNIQIIAQTNTSQNLLNIIQITDSIRSKGEYSIAIKRLLKVRNTPIFTDADCQSRSTWYHKMGVYNYDLYQSKLALLYWRDSALVIRQVCQKTTPADLANTYYAVALAHRDFHQTGQEREAILQAIQILEQLENPDPLDLAYKYHQVGRLFNRTNDIRRSLYYLEAAQRLYDSNGSVKSQWLADLYNEFGLVYTSQAKYDLAIDYFQRATKIHEKAGDLAAIAVRQQNIGKTFFLAERYDEAEFHIKRAFEINKKRGAKRMLILNYQSFGNLAKKRGLLDKAMVYFRAAIEIAKERNWPIEEARMYENIGDVQLLQNQILSALKSYQQALNNLVPGFTSTNLQENPDIDKVIPLQRTDLLRILQLKGEAFYLWYNQTRNIEYLRTAYQVFKRLDAFRVGARQEIQTSDSKFLLLGKNKNDYERAIEVALAWHKTEGQIDGLHQAYNYAAKNKAIVLLENLQDLKAKVKGIPPQVLAKENELRETYNNLERDLANVEGDSLQRLIADSLFSCRRVYEKLILEMERSYPNYYDLKYALPQTNKLKHLLEQIEEDRAIIEYFVGQKQIYIFVLSHKKLRYYIVERPTNFTAYCQELYHGTTKGISSDMIRDKLSELLLAAPIREMDSNIRRLTFIPDGPLLQISFDLLPHPFHPDHYLIEDYATSLAYSQQLIFANQKEVSRNLENFGGFGLVYDDFTLEGISSLYTKRHSITNTQRNTVGKLIYSDDEVEEIARILDGESWINSLAKKSTFLKEGHRFRTLHFAMHSLLDTEEPLNSCLVFSRTTNDPNFLLYASELYNMQLPAEMVVLSACNTGTGQIIKGEGVRSLARAFNYAGVPSMVASLWNASDYSTKDILVRFYQNLEAGQPKDIALQLAKQAYLKETAPTYQEARYWAHLKVIGDVAPIDFQTNTPSKWGWRAIPILILLLIGWYYRFYKKT